MSGTYPDEPCFAAVNFRSRRAESRSMSVSMRRQSRSLGGHLWEFTCRYDLMNRTDFAPVDGFLEAQQGTVESFQIVLPVISESTGSVQGTPQTTGVHAVGETQINLVGFTGTLPVGDVIKFDHDKVYKITQTLTGPGVLIISPPLRAQVNDGTTLIYDDVPFTVTQAAPIHEYDLSPGVKYAAEVDLVEAV